MGGSLPHVLGHALGCKHEGPACRHDRQVLRDVGRAGMGPNQLALLCPGPGAWSTRAAWCCEHAVDRFPSFVTRLWHMTHTRWQHKAKACEENMETCSRELRNRHTSIPVYSSDAGMQCRPCWWCQLSSPREAAGVSSSTKQHPINLPD